MESRYKRKEHRRSLSSSSQVDGSLKKSTSTSSYSSSRLCSRCSNSDRRNCSTYRVEEKLEVIHHVNHPFKKAGNCRTNRLADTSTKYNKNVSKYIAKMAKCITAQMKPHTYNPFVHISIVRFLKNVRIAWNTNGVHEDAAMWLLHFFMAKTVSAVLIVRLSDDGKSEKHSHFDSGETRYFTTYPPVDYFLLKKNATDEVITKTESDTTPFVQLSHMTPFQYAEELVTKTLCYGELYQEYALKEIFIEGLDASIRHRMREYWRNKNDTNLHDLTFHFAVGTRYDVQTDEPS